MSSITHKLICYLTFATVMTVKVAAVSQGQSPMSSTDGWKYCGSLKYISILSSVLMLAPFSVGHQHN